MTQKKLVDDIKANLGGSIASAEASIEAVIAAVNRTLVADGEVRVPGLGTLKVVKGVERDGANPATGAKIRFTPKPKVKLSLAAELKAMLG